MNVRRQNAESYVHRSLSADGSPYGGTWASRERQRRPRLADDGRLLDLRGREVGWWYVTLTGASSSSGAVVRRDKLNDPVRLARLRWRALEHIERHTWPRRVAAIDRCTAARAPFFLSQRLEQDGGFATMRNNIVVHDGAVNIASVEIYDSGIDRLGALANDGNAGEAYHQCDLAADRAWRDVGLVNAALCASLDLCTARLRLQTQEHAQPITFLIDGRAYLHPAASLGPDIWPTPSTQTIDLNSADLSPLRSGVYSATGGVIA